MTDTIAASDIADAARLVSLGMRPKLQPSRDVVYADLVKRYIEDTEFQEAVRAVADGLGLVVLGVSMRTGLVPAATDESLFQVRMDDYARQASMYDRGTDKLLHGIGHLACAALAFPRPDDLANETYVGRISVDQVDQVVREACRLLEEKANAADENLDPLDDAPQLEKAWRAYARRTAAGARRDGKVNALSTRGIVAKALRFLADQGLVVKVNDAAGGTYRGTPRYQLQVRELAAGAAFNELLELGVVAITDPTGSLHTVDTTL